MKIKNKYLKVPATAVIFFSLLLAVTAFYSGYAWNKTHGSGSAGATVANAASFEPEKSDRPTFQYFVMSFCPYGNQIEDILRPVYDLLASKADIRPQYIFDKITDLGNYCKQRSGDPEKCGDYVKSGYFSTEAECKQVVEQNYNSCNNESLYIKGNNGVYYGSLHGRVETNQDVREICAWNLSDDKTAWWNFIDNVNKNCTVQNADTCWEDQAKQAGLDTGKIAQCFNEQAFDLIEKEIAQTSKYEVTGSPTLIINGKPFPPEEAYNQTGSGGLKIGKTTFTQDQYRTPNVIKEAVCAAFKKSPKECKTELESPNDNQGAAAAQGGC